jgi:hypothetical protein
MAGRSNRAVNGEPGSAHGHPELLDPVDLSLHPRHVGLDPGRELHGVQVAPAAGLAVVPQPGRSALRGKRPPCPGRPLEDAAAGCWDGHG